MNNRSIVHSWESLEATVHHNSKSSLSYLHSWWFQVSNISRGGLKEKYYTKASAHVQPNATAEGGMFARPLTDGHKEYQCDFSLKWAWSMPHSLKGQVTRCSHTTPPTQTTTETKDIDCHDHPDRRLSKVQNLGQRSICKLRALSVCSCFMHQPCAAVWRLTKIKNIKYSAR